MTFKFAKEFNVAPKEDKEYFSIYKSQTNDSFALGVAEIMEKDSILIALYLGNDSSNLMNKVSIHFTPINSLTKSILGDSLEFMNYTKHSKLKRQKSNIIDDTVLVFENAIVGGKVFSKQILLIKMNGNGFYFGTYRTIYKNNYLFIDFSCSKNYLELINRNIESANVKQ